MAVVVDTNVPMVADGQSPEASTACQDRCVLRLAEITRGGGLLIDDLGLIIREYVRNLGFAGRPGAGKAFVKWAYDHQHDNSLCERVPITRRLNGDWRLFEEFPTDPRLHTFDRTDQKFAAVALASGKNAPVINAVDSDWWNHREALGANGVHVEFLCPDQFITR